MSKFIRTLRSKQSVVQTMSPMIKYGAAAALLLLVCFVLISRFAANDTDKETSTATQLSPSSPALVPQGLTPEKLETALKKERHRIKTNADEIAQLGAQVSISGKDVAALREASQKTRAELEFLRQKIDALKNAQAQRVAAKKKKVVRTSRRKKRQHPPINPQASILFDVAAIDNWGGVPQAVIRANGRLYTLDPGSNLLGWTVESIDGRAGSVTLRGRQGQHAKLTLNPN